MSIVTSNNSTRWEKRLGICFLLIIHQVNPIYASESSSEHFCGTTWNDAYENCHEPCPSGSDSECTQVGHICFGYTGCAAETGGMNNGGGNGIGNGGNSGNGNGGDEADDPYKNNMCGATWLTAMLSCSKPCPPGTDCPGGQTCYAATNCDKLMEPITSKMVMSLLGNYPEAVNMGSTERGVFSESVLNLLAAKMEENKVSINGADVIGQSFVEQGGRRMLQWNDTITGSTMLLESNVEQRRRLPTSSSALDVSMTITGEYRPPPYQNIDILIEDSINRASQTLVRDFRERGSRGGTQFFERVEGLSAVRVAEATERPSRSPSKWPTQKPTTVAPSQKPTYVPTVTPSASPTRNSEQMVQTGSGSDLYEGTTRSFGNIFEVKTKPNAETVIIKGLEFYSAVDERVSYEVWTKEGSWQGFEGKLESFTNIAKGQVRSRGACDETTAANCNSHFTRIPFHKFTNVAIRGGGGSRSFYITLTTKVLMYGIGESGSNDDFSLQVETPDIAVYQGAGVLVYPVSLATEASSYRKNRGFLGRIWYERNPCEDGSMEWPCTTRSPVSQFQLSTSKPTKQPTPKPTRKPTIQPTKQVTPPIPNPIPETQNVAVVGEEPTSPPPSPKPVIEYQHDDADVELTNIVLTLHNVKNEPMNNSEKEKYSEVLIDFLRSQPSLQGASVNVLNVTVWHQVAVADDNELRGKGKRPANSATRALQGESVSMEVGTREEAIDDMSFEASIEDTKTTESVPNVDATLVSMDVTTIIKTANSVLPSDVTDILLLHLIEDHKSALIDLFHAESFYTFFHDMSDLSGRIIVKVTNPPSPAPMQSQMLAASVNEESMNEEEDADEGTSIIGAVGVTIGALWCTLTFFSICYLSKARREMQNENLLRNGSSNQTQEDTKLKKEMSRFFAADGEHSGNTKLADDLVSSSSGEHSEFFDEEEGIMDSVYTTQPTTALFEGYSGEKSETLDKKKQPPPRSYKKNAFADRLRRKFSGVDADDSGAEQTETFTTAQENAPHRQRMDAFADHLQLNLSTVQENAPQRQESQTDEPKTHKEADKKEGGEELVENPMLSLITPARESDASAKKNMTKRSNGIHRRTTEGPVPEGSSSKPRENRRSSVGDPLKSVTMRHSTKIVEKYAELDSSNETKKTTSRTEKKEGEELGRSLIQSLIIPSKEESTRESGRKTRRSEELGRSLLQSLTVPSKEESTGESGRKIRRSEELGRSLIQSLIVPSKEESRKIRKSSSNKNHKLRSSRMNGKDSVSESSDNQDLGSTMVEMLFA